MFILPLPVWIVVFFWRLVKMAAWKVCSKSPGGVDWVYKIPPSSDCEYIAALLFQYANEFRAEYGLPQLTNNSRLELAAYNHGLRMGVSGEFAHKLSDGVNLVERIERCGYQWSSCRENIAWHSGSNDLNRIANATHVGWVNSPGHRENLLSNDVSELGVSVFHSRLDGKYYSVQNFGSPVLWARNEPPPSVLPPATSVPAPAQSPTPNQTRPVNPNPLPPKSFEQILSEFRP